MKEPALRYANLSLPPEAPDRLRELAEAFSQSVLTLTEGDAPVAWSCHNGLPGSLRATAFVWVMPAARRRGLGSALLRETFARMAAHGVAEALVHVEEDDGAGAAFLLKNGMSRSFSTLHMVYPGGPMPLSVVFEPYRDADYEGFRALQSAAFYDLRRSIGLAPYSIPLSPALRAAMAAAADRYFLLRDGGQIVAGGSTFEDEVDDVAVYAPYRGRGLGAAVVARAVNDLLARGVTPGLWCVDGNPARKLYLRLGFHPAERVVYYRKKL